jgi:hypothetical protein
MSLDRGAIDRQLRDIGEGEHWWEQREFRDLPHVLNADERINGLVQGQLLVSRRPRLRPARRWLIVATERRLVCLKQERFGRKQVDVPAHIIVRMHQRSRFRTYQITVDTTVRSYRIRIPKEDAFRFMRALEPLLPSPVQHVSSAMDPLASLPGFSAIAALPGMRGIVSSVMLPPPDHTLRRDVHRLESTVEQLKLDLERLQEQVTFLEDLLQQRAEQQHALPQPSEPAP